MNPLRSVSATLRWLFGVYATLARFDRNHAAGSGVSISEDGTSPDRAATSWFRVKFRYASGHYFIDNKFGGRVILNQDQTKSKD
jgi:hypothetical protein